MIDVFTKIVLAGACLVTFAWVILAQRRTIKRLSDAYLRLTYFQRALVALAVIVCTVYAQKPSTNDVNGVSGTNEVEVVEGGDTNEVEGTSGEAESFPLLMVGMPPFTSGEDTASPFSVTDFVAPYRLESVSTNVGRSYTLPASGAIRGTWHLTGAYEDVQRVALDGFAFPIGSDLCTSLWAYTWGKVRPQLKNASNEIAAVGAPMSAIPDVSRFWTAATSNDTYLLTWENFAAGRVPTTDYQLPSTNCQLLSAQIELFRNGDFITRSNDVESVWRRRMLCDLDEDGWIDDVDPTPEEFDENGFGPHQSLPVGDNTNYYYWVDLVVDQANARVTFEGEGHSALPDPDFIARAGETNRVMLLIGKSYVVNCDFPIRCVDKEDDEIEVSGMGNSLCIYWPIFLEFVPAEPLLLMAGPLLGAPSNGGGGMGIEVRPGRAGGGSFSWPGSFCCLSSAANGSPIFCCDGNCGCGGCSTGDITYRIGDHDQIYGGWYCACSSNPDDPHDGGDDPDDPPATAFVSVSFSKDVILFEKSYTNSYGQAVNGQSTSATLNCLVFGGTHGGRFSLTLDSGDCLNRVSGDEVPCEGIEVEAGAVLELEAEFNGKEHCEDAGDVVAHALFVENDTSRNVSSEASMTTVEVWTYVDERSIPWSQRKEIGVGEKVKIVLTPNDSELNLSVDKTQVKDRELYYFAPSRARTEIVTVSASDCFLPLLFQTFEPTALHAVCYGGTSNLVVGVAGNMGMHFTVYVLPTNVSLPACHVMEEGRVATDPIGIFRLSDYADWLDHSLHGAGSWIPLNSGNWYHDDAFLRALTNWGDGGSFTWPIPILWKLGEDGEPHYLQSSPQYDQRFEVDSDGTSRIRKFGYTIQQTTNLLYTVTEGIQ